MLIHSQQVDQLVIAVQLYFRNVPWPSPRTLKEALALKENPSIARWRDQIGSWAGRLARGELTEKEIIQETKDAGGYIEGAKALSRLVPSWVTVVTLPISVLLANRGLGTTSPTFYAGQRFHALKAYGYLAEKATASPLRPEYAWLMIPKEK